MRERQKTFCCFLFFLAFSHLNFSCKFECNRFSLFNVESFKPSIVFNNLGKTVIRLVYLSVSTIWTVKYCTKTWHYQILISFLLCCFNISLFFYPFPVQPLLLIVLHNGRKKTFPWEKHDLWRDIGRENNMTRNSELGESGLMSQGVGIRIWRFPVQTPLGTRLSLGIQPCYEAPSDLWIQYAKRSH